MTDRHTARCKIEDARDEAQKAIDRLNAMIRRYNSDFVESENVFPLDCQQLSSKVGTPAR